MAEALADGYATSSTDTGHKGVATDAKWALGHSDKIIDFGYRAVHETAVNAKAIISAFYGEAPKGSYFNSCLNGGREALMEAQRYPADYDGIVAGAPANYWTHLVDSGAWDMQATLAAAASYIPPRKVPAIQAATLNACDALDGVRDGIIGDPTKCRFNPMALLCKGPESDSCLTKPQATALGKLYTGPKIAKGQQIFPGHLPGGETGVLGWAAWITGSAPNTSTASAFARGFFANMVYQDAARDYRTFSFASDVNTVDSKMASIFNAVDPDLTAFKQRGGKLIIYHGWSDPAISPLNTVNYYQSVLSKMGYKDVSSFVRVYMVPGMQHCGGGPGTDVFGSMPSVTADPQHSISMALEHWVENGAGPDKIIAAKYKSDGDPSSGVVRTRPLCPYPQVAHYTGSGSTDEASNFACVKSQ
jgi:hypothetical protein